MRKQAAIKKTDSFFSMDLSLSTLYVRRDCGETRVHPIDATQIDAVVFKSAWSISAAV